MGNYDNRGGQGKGRVYQKEEVSVPDVAKAVCDGIDIDFIKNVEKFAKEFKASNTQVRNIFSAVKKIEMGGFHAEKFMMLRPRLAYAVTRDSNVRDLQKALSPAVDAVVQGKSVEEKAERFERFCLCCEAIIAYTRK